MTSTATVFVEAAMDTGLGTAETVALGISVLALLLSLVATFKEYVIPFKLEVLARDLVIPATSASASQPRFPLILPVTFLNHGYRGGVIQTVHLSVTDESGGVKRYDATMDVDLTSMIQGNHRLTGDHMKDPFVPFHMRGRETYHRILLFTEKSESDSYQPSDWEPRKYTFELFVERADRKRPKKLASFEWTLNEGVISGFLGGNTAVLSRTMDVSQL